jgi:hypothetical protein
VSAKVHLPQESAATSATETSTAKQPCPHELTPVYDLRRGNTCSDGFFSVLPSFTDQVLLSIEQRASPLLDGYTSHVQEFLAETPRSRGEYSLDYLLLGMVLAAMRAQRKRRRTGSSKWQTHSRLGVSAG